LSCCSGAQAEPLHQNVRGDHGRRAEDTNLDSTDCAAGGEVPAIAGQVPWSLSRLIVEEFLPIDSHISECFKFMSRDAPLSDAAQVFKDGLKSRSRVGAIFVTENGTQYQGSRGHVDVLGHCRDRFHLMPRFSSSPCSSFSSASDNGDHATDHGLSKHVVQHAKHGPG
jgi:hypothetical protein